MKKSVNNFIEWIGQTEKSGFSNIRRIRTLESRNLRRIYNVFYDMVNRPTYGDLNPIFDTDFSRRIGWYRFSIFKYGSRETFSNIG